MRLHPALKKVTVAVVVGFSRTDVDMRRHSLPLPRPPRVPLPRPPPPRPVRPGASCLGLELTAGDGGQSFAYVTCGDWDLSQCLPRQLRHHGTKPHAALRRWINIKHAFFTVTGKKAYGMAGMLKVLNMELEGRHHSGIDDCA